MRYINFLNLIWEFQRQTPQNITQPPTGFFPRDLPQMNQGCNCHDFKAEA